MQPRTCHPGTGRWAPRGAQGPPGHPRCSLQSLAPSQGCPKNAPLSATHPARWHAALMPPSFCTAWSSGLGDTHPGTSLTWPRVPAQPLPWLSLCNTGAGVVPGILQIRGKGLSGPAAGGKLGGDTSVTPAEIQRWLQPAGWEGTLPGSWRQGEEKSSVFRDGSAPLGSTAPLAMVIPQPAAAHQPSVPPNLPPPAGRAEPCRPGLPRPTAVP